MHPQFLFKAILFEMNSLVLPKHSQVLQDKSINILIH